MKYFLCALTVIGLGIGSLCAERLESQKDQSAKRFENTPILTTAVDIPPFRTAKKADAALMAVDIVAPTNSPAPATTERYKAPKKDERRPTQKIGDGIGDGLSKVVGGINDIFGDKRIQTTLVFGGVGALMGAMMIGGPAGILLGAVLFFIFGVTCTKAGKWFAPKDK